MEYPRVYFDDDSTLRMTNQEERQRSIDLAKECKQFLSKGKEFEKVVDSVLRDTKQLAANVDVQEKKAIGQNIKFKN